MAAGVAELPFGLRDAALFSWATGTLDVGVHVPRIRTIEVNVTRDETTLEADDVEVAVHSFGKGLEGSIEAGGINLDALVILEGGEKTTAGMTPNIIDTYEVLGDQTETYFMVEAQIYADDGGDVHLQAWKVKATNGPNWSANQGEFMLTQCDIAGIYDDSVSPSRLYTLIHHETTPVPIDLDIVP